MGWFSRDPKPPRPDPVGDVCRLLTGRPGEWKPIKPGPSGDGAIHHVPSGLTVAWDYRPGADFYSVVVGGVGTGGIELGYPRRADGRRIMDAVLGCLAARADARRLPLDETAKALARAVLDAGGADAAGCAALADRVKELLG